MKFRTYKNVSKEPVYGPLILIDNEGCDIEDYPKNVTGAIAFVKRGTCPFGTKSLNAGKAGAVAAVIYNNEQGSVQGEEKATIPTVKPLFT